MLYKKIYNSFDFKEPALSIFDPHKKGGFLKSASDEIIDYAKFIKPEDGKVKVLALFLGAGEYYGDNRNGDWFGEEDLIKKTKTFETDAHLYYHHKNKDPLKKSGDVEFACYNPRMHRTEGIMVFDLKEERNRDTVAKIERGEDVAVSMAARLKYDICSYCGNKAENFDQYCDHLRFNMRKIMPNYKKVYAINPDPVFFDISVVWKPADPTAYVLKKVASADILPEKKEQERIIISSLPKQANTEKQALIRKLSELEKEIEGMAAKNVSGDPKEEYIRACSSVEEFPEDTMSFLKGHDLKDVLSSLNKEKILLTPREFLNLIDKKESTEDVIKELPGSFSDLLDDSHLDSVFDNLGNAFAPILKHLKNFSLSRSLDTLPDRAMKITISPKPITKIYRTDDGVGMSRSGKKIIIVKKSNSSQTRDLARLYNLYKVAFLKENKSPCATLAAVATNYYL